ncbi:hypothetical protein CON64_18565 [Bacillus pseudomycoides]|nr:hypothetical protein CON64_18565 [Bacillus pseudomycoides]
MLFEKKFLGVSAIQWDTMLSQADGAALKFDLPEMMEMIKEVRMWLGEYIRHTEVAKFYRQVNVTSEVYMIIKGADAKAEYAAEALMESMEDLDEYVKSLSVNIQAEIKINVTVGGRN